MPRRAHLGRRIEVLGLSMIVDHRTYTVRPGPLQKQRALYETYGFAAQKRHRGSLRP